MYCYHCAYDLNESKVERQKSSYNLVDEVKEDSKLSYVCPRCGRLIHEGYDENDLKTLAMASHSELQRSRNDFARGMSFVSVGSILLIIGIIFFVLAKKPSNGFELVTTCTEFYVSLVLFTLAIILLGGGIFFVVRGITKNRKYTSLLKDLNNRNFVQ